MKHEFGIKVPKTVEEALALDKENANDLWWKAIQKKMSAAKVAFKILEVDDKPPIGSQYMKCHMGSQSRWRISPEKHAWWQEAIWLKPLRV